MSTHSAPTPQLIVVDGRMRGLSFAIPSGRSEIGRQAGLGILLDEQYVSLRHAALERAGGRVVLTDLGSTNGTWINRRRLHGTDELRDGDVVRVGSVSLRFTTAPDGGTSVLPPEPPTDRERGGDQYAFGDVRGHVQTGSGRQYTAGRDQYNADGDQYFDDSIRVTADYDPSDELFQGKGVGRALMVLGGCVALAGFGLWVYVIFSFMSGGGGDPGDLGSPDFNPFARELVPGVPMAPVGFAAFLAGGILYGIGSSMSKAARKREEQYRSGGRPRRQRM
jgi:hypothetical protein